MPLCTFSGLAALGNYPMYKNVETIATPTHQLRRHTYMYMHTCTRANKSTDAHTLWEYLHVHAYTFVSCYYGDFSAFS